MTHGCLRFGVLFLMTIISSGCLVPANDGGGTQELEYSGEGDASSSETVSEEPAVTELVEIEEPSSETKVVIEETTIVDSNGIAFDPEKVAAFTTEESPLVPLTPAQPLDTTLATEEKAEVVPATPLTPAKPVASEKKVTGDWSMWGGSTDRNMVSGMTGADLSFDAPSSVAGGKAEGGKNLLWIAKLGSQTYGNPIVSGGKVFVGTNNGAEYRPKHIGDRGCVVAFDAESGEFLWQLTREKLPQGRVNDWLEQGICSAPVVEGDRMWVVTNRCELICLDTEGFHDDENDGAVTDEVDAEELDADIVWNLDMIEELGVFPHNLATSSPVIYGDHIFVVTSNGVDEAHLEVPSPRSPSFLCVNKNTGEVVWEDNTPFDTILHGQWGSPSVGVVDGKAQVYFPGGNGWLYALDAETGEHIWKFDLNPKDSKWELYGRGDRNAIISTPVFYDNSVVLGVGQDPEHGEGVGHLYRIDCTKTGDVSPTLAGDKPNPNSAQIWHYGGIDTDGSLTGKEKSQVYRRTISTVAIHEGLVYAPDLSGRFHCIDFATGKRQWEADLFTAIWGSPMVIGDHVLLGDEDGNVSIFKCGREQAKKPQPERKVFFAGSVYSTPTVANGKLYVTDRSTIYVFSL